MRDLLDKLMTLEALPELEYSGMVFQEGLRFRPSAPTSHFYAPKKDLTLGNFSFKKGDVLAICFEALGHDPAQWQRPTEFLP